MIYNPLVNKDSAQSLENRLAYAIKELNEAIIHIPEETQNMTVVQYHKKLQQC